MKLYKKSPKKMVRKLAVFKIKNGCEKKEILLL